MLKLTHKELLELKFWLTCNFDEEQAKLSQYLAIWDNPEKFYAYGEDTIVLEIGTGPQYGFLPFLNVDKKYGVDPLYPLYYAAGILAERNGVFEVPMPFEYWDTDLQFDAIFTANALDHGEMGFYLLPKIWKMLKPGGLFFLHVHLRPKDLLNLVHDHCLTEEDLDKHLSYTNLVEVKRKIFENDIDGNFCKALVGIWRKP